MPRATVAAIDCSTSEIALGTATEVPDVAFELRTDPTNTSLLMTNTGVLTAVVVPGPDGFTRLMEAPYANPGDAASVAALEAVANSGFAARVEGLPEGVPLDQVYVVPPGWSVCALSGRQGVAASAQYLRDKLSSAQYEASKQLAEQLAAYVTPAQMKASGTLVKCAEGAGEAALAYPDRDGLELYTAVIGDGSACRSAYKLLLSNDEQATRTIQSRALDFLEASPKLLSNSKLVLALSKL